MLYGFTQIKRFDVSVTQYSQLCLRAGGQHKTHGNWAKYKSSIFVANSAYSAKSEVNHLAIKRIKKPDKLVKCILEK